MYGRSLSLEKIKDLRMVVGILFEGFPCEELVVFWGYAREGNASGLVRCGYPVEVRAVSMFVGYENGLNSTDRLPLEVDDSSRDRAGF